MIIKLNPNSLLGIAKEFIKFINAKSLQEENSLEFEK